MAFTFTNYAALPVPKSPMAHMLDNALKTYQQATNASYMKREKEADLFAKELGPLAALASNPNFTGFNPEVQKMIAHRIGGYLGGQKGQGGHQSATQEGESSTPPGYASGEDIYNRLSQGADVALKRGGKSAVGRARLVGTAEQFGLPASIAKALGGSEAAGENAAFDQAKEEGIKNLMLRGYSEHSARENLKQKQGENSNSYKKRIKALFVNESEKKQPEEAAGNEAIGGIEEIQQPKGASVLVETPDGKQWFVPADKIADARRMGAKEVK